MTIIDIVGYVVFGFMLITVTLIVKDIATINNQEINIMMGVGEYKYYSCTASPENIDQCARMKILLLEVNESCSKS